MNLEPFYLLTAAAYGAATLTLVVVLTIEIIRRRSTNGDAS